MITIRMQVIKRCPYRAETDIGDLAITMPADAPELHDLAKQVSNLGISMISHEEYTRQILALLPRPALVVTHWRTGLWDVEVTEGDDLLREPVEPASA